jgi:hypothetical protein
VTVRHLFPLQCDRVGLVYDSPLEGEGLERDGRDARLAVSRKVPGSFREVSRKGAALFYMDKILSYAIGLERPSATGVCEMASGVDVTRV